MGRVAFIGAGPGAADLVTLRGARLLAQADVVLADALIDAEFRTLAPQARWIEVGKRGFRASTSQPRINALLRRAARSHALVVRLKGGDPSLFGRLDEELETLAAAGIDCEVVPGVSAALAAAADTRKPLTRRGRARSVAFSTAMTRDGALQARRGADSEVFYMAGRQLGALGRALRDAGWPADTAVSVVSRAGCADGLHSSHRVDDLARAALLHAGRPTVVIVGAAAEPLDAAAPAAAPAVAAAPASIPLDRI